MIRMRAHQAMPVRLDTDEGPALETREPRVIRWNFVLVCFMRTISLIWLFKGVMSWAGILGVGHGVPFDDMSTGLQAAMIYFAVIDILAAVGLWLTSTWGGVLWLLAVMSHLILAAFFPRFVSNGALLIALFIFALMIYLVLSWLASIEE